MSRNIEGKVVVITGASSGLGESTARHLAKLGATVVLGARRKDRLDAIVKDIQAGGGKALAVTVDVTKRTDVEGLVKKAVDTYGKIDVLMNNAGIMPIAPLALLKVDEWDRMIDLNIKGCSTGLLPPCLICRSRRTATSSTLGRSSASKCLRPAALFIAPPRLLSVP
jgi:NADP-dependent 3-hydroxy acid dehydrogenase YdfG